MASDPSSISFDIGPGALMVAVNCPGIALMRFFHGIGRFYVQNLPCKKEFSLGPDSFSDHGSINSWATRRGNMAK